MRLLDSSDPMVSRSDDDDLHRQAIDAAMHDDGATRIGLDPYPAEERDERKLDAGAFMERQRGTGLRSVRRARRAA